MKDPVRDALDELRRSGLKGEDPDRGLVPDVIARSWRRSISRNVASEGPAQRFTETDPESILLRAAEPVLDRWQHQLTDSGTTLFVSDRAGCIVARRVSDRSTQQRLDRANAVEGFSYSEEIVGTNGLGTAMVEKGPVLVRGTQHYNELLADITCAAVPLATPTGSVIGAISLGSLDGVANPLTMSVTREIGLQIEERLRASSRPQDLALAMSFMRYSNAQRPTIVLDRESLLANTPGLPYVNVSTQVTLWEALNDRSWVDGGAVTLEIADGAVEVVARRVVDGPHVHYVAHFSDRGAPQLSSTYRAGTTLAIDRRPAAVAVVGPAGSGRAAAVQQLRRRAMTGAAALEVSGTAGIRWADLQASLKAGRDVVVRRADELSETEASRLSSVVREHRSVVGTAARTATVYVTADPARSARSLKDVIEQADRTEQCLPLAETPERIPGLVTDILEQVDQDHRHTLSPTAMQALMVWRWPGNLTELVAVVTEVVRRVDRSVIERRDLPEHLQQVAARRHLTPLEEAERETIVRTLSVTSGNRSKAAARLGIGRTTLYRRLRRLGIESDEASL